jgi:hypothetical protein
MLGEFHAVARRLFRADFTAMSYQGAIQMVTFASTALFLRSSPLCVHRKATQIT